jgi:SAM-dependent methyltransferase
VREAGVDDRIAEVRMTHNFEKDYWEQHWDDAHGDPESAPNPYLVQETSDLAPGTALDAGCGTGSEAIWLAEHGWRVVAADISATALECAAARAVQASVSDSVTWVEADLTTWEPNGRFDLVVTNYAHPAIPQLAFYQRIADWVAPRGSLLIVGHSHASDPSGHHHDHDSAAGGPSGGHPPAEATVTLADITGVLDSEVWRIDTGEELTRTLAGGPTARLHDVVVRATRLR